MTKVGGHAYTESKICVGNYEVETSIGTFSVHEFKGKWYVRLRGCGLVAIEATKANAMREVRDTIRDSLSGETIRYLREETD
ncbi:hypothetical protein ACI2KR_06860 [Pseudomonas luteola]